MYVFTELVNVMIQHFKIYKTLVYKRQNNIHSISYAVGQPDAG